MAIPEVVERGLYNVVEPLINGNSKLAARSYKELKAALEIKGATAGEFKEFNDALHSRLHAHIEVQPASHPGGEWTARKGRSLAGLEKEGEDGVALTKMLNEKPSVSAAQTAGARKSAISPEAVRASQQRGPRGIG